jgi:hypothetical protein
MIHLLHGSFSFASSKGEKKKPKESFFRRFNTVLEYRFSTDPMPSRRVVRTHAVRSRTSTDYNPRLWIVPVIFACLAVLFGIIGLVTPGWDGQSIIKTYVKSYTATIVLCSLAWFCLLLATITIILFAQRLLISFSSAIKASSVIFLTLGGILIVAAYLAFGGYNENNYSYYLMATSGIFAFISSTIAAFWCGQNWATI